jgi:hypothetical protein
MEVSNLTTDTITLKENEGYIESLDVVVLAPKGSAEGKDKNDALTIFTETPSFIISGYTYPAEVGYYIRDDDDKKMFVSIYYKGAAP